MRDNVADQHGGIMHKSRVLKKKKEKKRQISGLRFCEC